MGGFNAGSSKYWIPLPILSGRHAFSLYNDTIIGDWIDVLPNNGAIGLNLKKATMRPITNKGITIGKSVSSQTYQW